MDIRRSSAGKNQGLNELCSCLHKNRDAGRVATRASRQPPEQDLLHTRLAFQMSLEPGGTSPVSGAAVGRRMHACPFP
jgi:hypothetical protein